MTTGDLVALGAVKNWLGVTTDDDDALLAALISQISRGIYNYTPLTPEPENPLG